MNFPRRKNVQACTQETVATSLFLGPRLRACRAWRMTVLPAAYKAVLNSIYDSRFGGLDMGPKQVRVAAPCR